MSLIYAEELRKCKLTAAEWTESVHPQMMKSQLRLRLQNRVPFPFCICFLYTVVVTRSPKRIPRPQFRNQKPPHAWYHGVPRFYRFLGHVISLIFHDITHDIMPFLLHHMTQKTVKSCHTWYQIWYHEKKQLFHNYVISHNCDITQFVIWFHNYVMSYGMSPGWRRAGARGWCPPAPRRRRPAGVLLRRQKKNPTSSS